MSNKHKHTYRAFNVTHAGGTISNGRLTSARYVLARGGRWRSRGQHARWEGLSAGAFVSTV